MVEGQEFGLLTFLADMAGPQPEGGVTSIQQPMAVAPFGKF